MKMRLVLGSLLRRRHCGRWQWIALIGLLAFLNIAQGSSTCYPFRIVPTHLRISPGEKNQVMSVEDWQGTLYISHNCPKDVITIGPDERTGIITISSDSKVYTGECLITAIDARKDGLIDTAAAVLEVVKQPLHAHIINWRDPLGISDFSSIEFLFAGQLMRVEIDDGVMPYSMMRLDNPSVCEVTLIDGSPQRFTVKGLKKGFCTVTIKDGDSPPDILWLNIEVI